MTAIRRSGRARRQAQTVYDEAKKRLEEKAVSSAEKAARGKDDDDSSTEASDADESQAQAEESMNEKEDDDSSSSEDSSVEEETIVSKKAARKSPAKKQRKRPSMKKIRVELKPKKPKATASRKRVPAGTAPSRSLQTALASLSRKVLEEGETGENSLVAALLQSYKSDRTVTKQSQRLCHQDHRTVFTPQLERIAHGVVEQHMDDPNKAQVALLNLIFRSVGGSLDTNLNPDQVTLENMDDEWAEVTSQLVEEMRHTPVDQVLLCADPQGAIHAAAVESHKEHAKGASAHSALGVREYRKIYEEFWYVLGGIALSDGISTRDRMEEDDGDDSSDSDRRPSKSFTSTTRFDAELARDVIVRIVELVQVGQPDIRAAATIAALQMGHALLDRTVVLGSKIDVATRQFEAAAGGKSPRGKLSRKAESLKHQKESLERTCEDLEEVVFGLVFKAVFMHRYRDSNMHIRAACLNALSRMTLQRPDLFLTDKYLKYFGWMMSDKCECVRVAAVSGLLAPFQQTQQESGSKRSSGSYKIDVNIMKPVLSRFLTVLVDRVIDVSIPVQEKAMALLLSLCRKGFLDELIDEEESPLWLQVNHRALAPDTSPLVRRDALYFVIEQLEPFIDGDNHDGEDAAADGRRFSRDNKPSLVQSSERVAANCLTGLASWVAHVLTEGPIPIEAVRIDLADFIVHSLRDMPEHQSLATNWPAMLKAIGEDNVATAYEGDDAGHRVDTVEQRVLVQMLACAAQVEVGAVADSEFILRDVDADVVANMPTAGRDIHDHANTKKKRGKAQAAGEEMPHEVLSVALLKSLPELLIKFKGDSAVLRSLTSLPKYLLPSVFSLPQRKNDFTALVKNLVGIFLESADTTVLQNTALSLTFLSHGDHARAPDGRLQLQRMAATLRDKLVGLFNGDSSLVNKVAKGGKKRKVRAKQSPAKRRRSGRSSISSQSSASNADVDEDDDVGAESSDAADVEYAIYLSLKRLCVLSMRCDIADLLDSDEGEADDGIEVLCNTIVKGIAHRLDERKVTFSDATADSDDLTLTVPDVWKECDDKVHGVVANSINEALSLLLCVTSWKLREVVEEQEAILLQDGEPYDDTVDEEDVEDHIVLRLRNQLVAIVELCFDQYTPDPNEDGDGEERGANLYTTEHIAFADSVQCHAGKVAADLRMLFPKEWKDAANPLLRACALTDDVRLIGGFVRYFRSKEHKLRENEDQEQEDTELVQSLLLPLGRGLCTNWRGGNRREAGVALAHVTGSGKAASDLVGAMSRLLKKVHPVRLLEAHMACLRQSYEDWMDNEPEEMESDRPSDGEMAIYEQEEKRHVAMFQSLEQMASRLSMSLGVGKLSDPKLSPALFGFIKEGVRFAFSNEQDSASEQRAQQKDSQASPTGSEDNFVDDDLMLGSRLSFLPILGRYVNWIKRNKEQLASLREDLDEREEELRAHPDFAEVHEDDLEALASFRALLGLKESGKKESSSPRSVYTAEHDEDEYGDGASDYMTPTSSIDRSTARRRRMSRGSSVGSMKSKLSTQSSLSPLYEEDATMGGSDEEQFSPSSAKRKRVTRYKSTSLGSSISHSTVGGRAQTPIAEGSGESSGEDDDM